MKACIKVTYWDVSKKELYIDVQIWRLFLNIEVINYF